MKRVLIIIVAGILFLPGCGGGGPSTQSQSDSSKNTGISTGSDSVPGIDTVAFSDTVALEADEYMHFNKALFKVRAAKKIVLVLKNTSSPKPGMSMLHNVVILAKGTDIADFADAVKDSKKENYLPASVAPLVVAHTKTVSGGETDRTDFLLPATGTYDFICSFPGHWGTMQGKIVAK